ncbi:hypothetical protein CCHR01_17508 [Colletotrichum chrysophilum]|uniref:Uncharacterized protein n=1 Tax=Colletotrichum chrysophilum TaxID=1836956 RepID=A0AAD9A4A1_9PEZI|nr:hypothetical protein CCHR01_17508 [Colletotrichum chrysophilum]
MAAFAGRTVVICKMLRASRATRQTARAPRLAKGCLAKSPAVTTICVCLSTCSKTLGSQLQPVCRSDFMDNQVDDHLVSQTPQHVVDDKPTVEALSICMAKPLVSIRQRYREMRPHVGVTSPNTPSHDPNEQQLLERARFPPTKAGPMKNPDDEQTTDEGVGFPRLLNLQQESWHLRHGFRKVW